MVVILISPAKNRTNRILSKAEVDVNGSESAVIPIHVTVGLYQDGQQKKRYISAMDPTFPEIFAGDSSAPPARPDNVSSILCLGGFDDWIEPLVRASWMSAVEAWRGMNRGPDDVETVDSEQPCPDIVVPEYDKARFESMAEEMRFYVKNVGNPESETDGLGVNKFASVLLRALEIQSTRNNKQVTDGNGQTPVPRAELAVEMESSPSDVPKSVNDVDKIPPSPSAQAPTSAPTSSGSAAPLPVHYRCRACRTPLFLPQSISDTHESTPSCTSFILSLKASHPLSPPPHLIEGKLHCFKCSTLVGKFNLSGMKCGCGKWGQEGIAITKSKVDFQAPEASVPPLAPIRTVVNRDVSEQESDKTSYNSGGFRRMRGPSKPKHRQPT